MMRSLFSSVSGIIAHQTKMDVIGNNISNVNTLGFRASRVTFQEVYSETIKGSGAPDAATGRGGTNPMQVGLGIGVSAVDTFASRGSTQRTDSPTDLSIEGEGFFIVKDTNDTGFKFSRAGNFTLDKTGNLVTSSGISVYGWQDYGGTAQSDGTYKYDTEKQVEPINLYQDDINGNKQIINAMPTSQVNITGNLRSTIDKPTLFYKSITDETTTDGTETPVYEAKDFYRDDNVAYSVPFTAYDSLGNDNKVKIKFWKVTDKLTPAEPPASENKKWVQYNPETLKVKTDDNDYTAPSTTWHWTVDGGDSLKSESTGEMTFYANGETFYYENSDRQPVNTSNLTQKQINELQLTRVYPNSITPSITLAQNSGAGADGLNIKLDFSKMTQFSSDSSGKVNNVNGYASGTLVNFTIGADGILTGVYSNGQQQPLGMIGLANFQNPAGLLKVGENLYMPTANSGEFQNGYKPGSEGLGNLNPGTLEMSNVDLSKEFTDMIVTQRGFQANGKIISTSDEMLQELVNLKR